MWVILGCLLVFIMFCGLFTAIKRIWFCHWVFALLVISSAIFFTVLGLGLIIGGSVTKDSLDDLWDNNDTDNGIQQAFGELYSSADTIYCKAAPYNCVWYVTHPVLAANITTSPIELSTTIRNVQQCKDGLSEAYKDYNIDFDDVGELSDYLDYFGDIEEEYEWSGVCEQKEVYYFWDSAAGKPGKGCKDSIKDDLIDGIVIPVGIGYLIIGMFLWIISFIQFGLCCRDKNETVKDSHSFSRV